MKKAFDFTPKATLDKKKKPPLYAKKSKNKAQEICEAFLERNNRFLTIFYGWETICGFCLPIDSARRKAPPITRTGSIVCPDTTLG